MDLCEQQRLLAKMPTTRTGERTKGPQKLDLACLGASTGITVKEQELTVPVFAVFRFANAHNLRTFKVCFERFRFLNYMGYCIDRELVVSRHSHELPAQLYRCEGAEIWEYDEADGGAVAFVASVSEPLPILEDKRRQTVRRNQLLLRPSIISGVPATDKYLLAAMDKGWQMPYLRRTGYGYQKESELRLRATYDGVLPVEVQQLVHRAKREYDEVILIAEANWNSAAVEEIQPKDPLVVGIKGDEAFLLCVFDETIQENYYAKEFSA